jgi:hypothetical protein
MSDVYRKTCHVLLHLGPGSEKTRLTFKYIRGPSIWHKKDSKSEKISRRLRDASWTNASGLGRLSKAFLVQDTFSVSRDQARARNNGNCRPSVFHRRVDSS